ncbi:hypothetical protein RFI_08156 [Reticulomyxa filosa]|uniref:Uncharacterized protein n=1 Tax=Reticulomyxa filosa TaxID=46433 RepID=X6NRR3_RETFI|nr:hypothetical protein RFI_08156 [Reticulomyxa filosa]|eukprot:ETO28970.1 hypothetical protein RFI_08156 [Reticulomyxa filosa]
MLDEIRNPKKLKTVNKSARSQEKPKAKEPEKVGLMDHLKAKLAQRNKLMRGITESEIKVPTLATDAVEKKLEENRSSDKIEYGEVTKENNSTGLAIHTLRHMSTIMNWQDDDSADNQGVDDEWKDNE